jgi:hypothetical protein
MVNIEGDGRIKGGLSTVDPGTLRPLRFLTINVPVVYIYGGRRNDFDAGKYIFRAIGRGGP